MCLTTQSEWLLLSASQTHHQISCILELAIPGNSLCHVWISWRKSTYQPRPPSAYLLSYVGADLVPGFDIDTAGLSSTIHIELAKVSRAWIRLPKLQINSSLQLTLYSHTHKGREGFGLSRRATSHIDPMSVAIARITLNVCSRC